MLLNKNMCQLHGIRLVGEKSLLNELNRGDISL